MTPRRIFILRPDNLGDLVLFSGALRHLRRHWPQAHITLCVRRFGEELFAHCPYVDRIVSFDRVLAASKGQLRGLPLFRGRDRLGALLLRLMPGWFLGEYRSDVAILPLVSPFRRYHEVMRQLPAKTRIGICGNTAIQTVEDDLASRSGYSQQWDASALPWNFPEIEANRLFLEFLGVNMKGENLAPEFWTTTQERQKASQLLPADPSCLTLGLAPAAFSIAGKNLPATWFAQALKNLSGPPLRIVLLGSAVDVPVCRAVAQELAGLSQVRQILDFTGQTTVGEFIECLQRCDIVFSQETAALHIATALHKPVLGIVGGGHFGRFYPWGDPARARFVNKPLDCYGCNWHCIYPTLRCMQEIQPEDAEKELQGLIDAQR